VSTVPKNQMAPPVVAPTVHPKSPATGLGLVDKTPPLQGTGPSKAVPVTGKGKAGVATLTENHRGQK
jgi:hypothetical protein